MDLTLLLGIFAGVVQVSAFAFYNRNVFRGMAKPNTATWSLWFFLTIVNAASYAAMTGDIAKYFLPVASAAATTVTFAYALLAGKFSKIDPWDPLAFALGFCAIFIWWQYQSAAYANLIVLCAIAVSFWPTYRGVWKNPGIEEALPWYLWAFAYLLSSATVLLRLSGSLFELVLPVSLFLLHFAVGPLTRRSVPVVPKSLP